MSRRAYFFIKPRPLLLAFLLVGLQQSSAPKLWAQTTTTPVTTASLIQVTSINGASSSFIGNASVSPQIYGGIAGSENDCPTKDGTTTCNNCGATVAGAPGAASTDKACNMTRIYASLTLTINFVVTGTVTPVNGVYPHASLVASLGGSSTTPTPVPNEIITGNQLNTGSSDTISVKWSDLCGAVTGDSTCGTITPGSSATYTPVNIYIALDTVSPPQLASGTTYLIQLGILNPAADGSGGGGTNGNSVMNGCFTGLSSVTSPGFGFCNFYARAGDQKAYIESPAPNTSCNTNYTGVRVFYAPDNGSNQFVNATYNTPHSDFQLDGSCNPVGDWAVTGLTNDQGYFFRISMLDLANNNAFILNAGDGTAGDGITDQASCPTTTNYDFNTDAACGQYATPGKVIGILPNTLNCFIATAAYGSPFAPAVVTLRKFRNEFLLPYKLGMKFVRYYYEVSPRLSGFIYNTPWLKTSVQIALAPIWAVAWFMLIYGPFGALLFLIGTLVLIILQMKDARRGYE